jgi:ribosomal protein S18 acetylase RimI-like enzyme
MPLPDSTHPRLQPLREGDFATLTALAETIWRQHYTPIIGNAQVEYMLAGRYTAERLRAYIGAENRWMDILFLGAEAVGYCSYSRSAPAGPQEMKLEQLYLRADQRGKGLGGFMLRHVEARAREQGQSSLMLTVNKHNEDSIAIYRKAGFTVREEAVFDIGNGFVMDDYVMVKELAPRP